MVDESYQIIDPCLYLLQVLRPERVRHLFPSGPCTCRSRSTPRFLEWPQKGLQRFLASGRDHRMSYVRQHRRSFLGSVKSAASAALWGSRSSRGLGWESLAAVRESFTAYPGHCAIDGDSLRRRGLRMQCDCMFSMQADVVREIDFVTGLRRTRKMLEQSPAESKHRCLRSKPGS